MYCLVKPCMAIQGFRLVRTSTFLSSLLSNSYREMQGLLEAISRHAAAIEALKTKMTSTLNPGE